MQQNSSPPLASSRLRYPCELPKILSDLSRVGFASQITPTPSPDIVNLLPHLKDKQDLIFIPAPAPQPFPALRVGALFSGGPAPGGHNVLTGLFDALLKLAPGSTLIGFLNGPKGLIRNDSIPLNEEVLAPYRNQGGFDLLGSGRTKLETPEDFASAHKALQEHALDGLVIIGGDDSNTNAALLANYLLEKGSQISVIGVPKTIDGDLQSARAPLSFGFDTATKIYAEMIGNLARDAKSAGKYFHFVKLMGRAASHIALECALLTHPNIVLIGEERRSLLAIVDELVDFVQKRLKEGRPYGVILLPEGLIEFMPEIGALLGELTNHKPEELSAPAQTVWKSLPGRLREQLLLKRDPHGNIPVSMIETEKLLIEMVEAKIGPFEAVPHFFGYEGRSAFPTNFDATYGYALGHVAALLIGKRETGYMAGLANLKGRVAEWEGGASSLLPLIHLEKRKGVMKPVIAKHLVDLKGKAYQGYVAEREKWRAKDCYQYPGPIQLGAGEWSVPLIL